MKKAFFLLLLALPVAFAFTDLPTATNACTCDTPTNVHKSSSTTTSATFSWNAVGGAASYKVKYVRQSDGYQSPEWNTNFTSFTFTGLSAGAYKFYFATNCDGGASDFIVIDDLSGA